MGDLLWLLSAPRATLRRLLVAQPIGLAVFVLVAGQLSASFARFLAVSGSGAPWAVLDCIFTGTLTLTGVFIGTAFFHLFATLLGGRGNPGQLFWGLMVSGAPWVLATPLAIVALGVGSHLPAVYHLLLFIGVLVLASWSLGLKAYLIASLYNLSGSGGLFVFFVGWGAAMILGVTALFAGGMSWMTWVIALASGA